MNKILLMKPTNDRKCISISCTEGPRLTRILGLGKTVLHEIRVSGTVVSPLLTRKNRCSGNCVSDFRVSRGPPVIVFFKDFLKIMKW